MEAIADLGERLESFWRNYGEKARTKTRDTRVYGLSYLKGLLRLKTDRNMAEIAREADISEQNMQHFISNSPWSGSDMIEQVQQAISDRPELEGGMLILDESADVKYGETVSSIVKSPVAFAPHGAHNSMRIFSPSLKLPGDKGKTSLKHSVLFLPLNPLSHGYLNRYMVNQL